MTLMDVLKINDDDDDDDDRTSFTSLCKKIDDKIFEKSVWTSIMCCITLSPVNVTGHNLRRRTRSFVLPTKCKTVLQDKNLFKGILCKDSYQRKNRTCK